MTQKSGPNSIGGVVANPLDHSDVLAVLAEELRLVEATFHQQLDIQIPPVERLCRYIERYRGKMLRPSITIICGLAAAANVLELEAEDAEKAPSGQAASPTGPSVADLRHFLGQSHRVVAAVTEMVHMATLVHDDVLDDAEMRRRGATVNYLHGNEAAVLLGDYLISNAFHLCSSLGRPELNERIGAVTNSMCAGELLQLHHRSNWSIDVATYFEIIDRKTASLIGLACELGAGESGAGVQVSEALGEYGRKMGQAFQIQDDLLDLIGEESVVGKSLGKDLEKQKLTLPIILCFQQADPAAREEMLALLAAPDAESHAGNEAALRTRLIDSGAVREAHRRAEQLVAEGCEALTILEPSPAKHLLEAMAATVIARKF